MMDTSPSASETRIPKSTAKSARKKSKAAPVPDHVLQYVVMHENNIAVCLAGGLLAPRPEESAARDHHLLAGGLVLESVRPSGAAFVGARGDLPYGMLVIAEVRRSSKEKENEVPLLPLRQATRLVFPSVERKTEFQARMSAYADVPENIIPLEVDSGLFDLDVPNPDSPTARSRGELPHEPGVEAEVNAERAQHVTSRIKCIDRSAGALAASLSTLSRAEAAPLLAAFNGFGADFADGTSPSEFAAALAMRVDDSQDAVNYAPLIRTLASLLTEGVTDDGFSAASLLRRLEALGSQETATAEESRAWERFVRFAQDVVALKREPPARAFADGDGSALPRGALLFLLNPEPETLAAVRVRTPHLGARVYFVAAILVGLRAGLTRLPRELKSNREQFLAVPEYINDVMTGRRGSLRFRQVWDPISGERVQELLWDGAIVSGVRFPVDVRMAMIAEAVRAAGVEAFFSADNGFLTSTTSAEGAAALLVFEPSSAPTFPRVNACEVSATYRIRLANRTAQAIVTSINETSQVDGVYAGYPETDNGRAIRLAAYAVEPVSQTGIKDAIAAVRSRSLMIGNLTRAKGKTE